MAKKPIPRGKIIGPFRQILTMKGLTLSGKARDDELDIVEDAFIRTEEGKITHIGNEETIQQEFDEHLMLEKDYIAMPGLIDAHTHLCYAGKRAKDFSLRLRGTPYREIASLGGGILETVRQTRAATLNELIDLLIPRTHTLVRQGVTTCEIKSGYGLTPEDEMKILEAIKRASLKTPLQIVPTCLAAHTKPPEYKSNAEYLRDLTVKLLPAVLERNLSHRIDIFIDESGFKVEEARLFLAIARDLGFKLVIHADQFDSGGARLACEMKALSADHLEHTPKSDFIYMKSCRVIPIVLPGACLGLGVPFPNVRGMLDAGLPVAIATDLNPGSAPMGHLLCQASILAMNEKLSTAEALAGITCRAARALDLHDRGLLKEGKRADFIAFETDDYRDLLWAQGNLMPSHVFIGGERVI